LEIIFFKLQLAESQNTGVDLKESLRVLEEEKIQLTEKVLIKSLSYLISHAPIRSRW